MGTPSTFLALTPPQPDLLEVYKDSVENLSKSMELSQAINMSIARAAHKSVEGLAGYKAIPAEYLARPQNMEKTLA